MTYPATPELKLSGGMMSKITNIASKAHSEPLIPSLQTLRRVRHGNIISRIFRHIFAHNKIKRILGTNLAILALIGTNLTPSTSASIEPEMSIIEPVQTNFSTQASVAYPLKEIRITQTYSFFHPGVDFDGLTGEPINAIMKGVVAEVNYSRFAYGNAVLIDHGEGLTSLYAHLSKINIVRGQGVENSTVLGEMGASGRAFGDHLHLEVRDHGKSINPLLILPKAH